MKKTKPDSDDEKVEKVKVDQKVEKVPKKTGCKKSAKKHDSSSNRSDSPAASEEE